MTGLRARADRENHSRSQKRHPQNLPPILGAPNMLLYAGLPAPARW
jgi:hypothetical protein